VSGLALRHRLDEAGLNRQHVFALAQLPQDLLAPLAVQAHERQLIVLALAGRRLWERLQAQGPGGDDPIDDYSLRVAASWLAAAAPGARYRFVYPRGLPEGRHLGLQRLGALAGWHHAAPFMLGVDAQWGSWFAYRVAILADTCFPATPVAASAHPCLSCDDKPCIGACPAHALDQGVLQASACRTQRLREPSPCALDCPARQACPVGAGHRYAPDQIRHGAERSLEALRRWG
jgi:hypothetical protein